MHTHSTQDEVVVDDDDPAARERIKDSSSLTVRYVFALTERVVGGVGE